MTTELKQDAARLRSLHWLVEPLSRAAGKESSKIAKYFGQPLDNP